MIKRLLLLLLLAYPTALSASPLVADLSNYRIDMDSSFSGSRIFLFGARNDNGDVIAVVRGPSKDFVVRKKEKIAGIWINSERMKFYDVPDFYAVATSKPLSEIEQAALFRQLGIGQENLLSPPADPKKLEPFKHFSQAFFDYQYGRRLYTGEPGVIQFMGEMLFKTVIEFPDNIPPGAYTAEFYLLSDGEITGMQSTPITVVKTGLDAFLYAYAHQHPALYGLSAIVLALVIGWFTGRLFERM